LAQYAAAGNLAQPTVETSVYDADNRLMERDMNVSTSGGGSGWTVKLQMDLGYQANGLLSSLSRYAAFDLTAFVNSDPMAYAGMTAYQYDAANRMTGILHSDYGGGGLAQYTYSYDAGSRLSSEVDNGNAISYSYDQTNQLITSGPVTYHYDATGNRTTVIDDTGGTPVTSAYATTTGNEMTGDGTPGVLWRRRRPLAKVGGRSLFTDRSPKRSWRPSGAR
jgi:hypothetical protein